MCVHLNWFCARICYTYPTSVMIAIQHRTAKQYMVSSIVKKQNRQERTKNNKHYYVSINNLSIPIDTTTGIIP